MARDDSGGVAKRLFGSTQVPPELEPSLQAFRSGTLTDRQQDETVPVLQRLLATRLEQINSQYEQSVMEYLQMHEREAFYTGNRLALQMMNATP